MFQSGTAEILCIMRARCIEVRRHVRGDGSILNPMFSQDYHQLEREFNETAHQLADPLDLGDRNQMTQRLLTIILEARELAKILGYPAPRWCVVPK